MDYKRHILLTAVSIAKRDGLAAVTRKAVAERGECAAGTISYHYNSMDKLIDAVMQHAVKDEILTIVAEGLAIGHAVARAAPATVKAAAAECLAAS